MLLEEPEAEHERVDELAVGAGAGRRVRGRVALLFEQDQAPVDVGELFGDRVHRVPRSLQVRYRRTWSWGHREGDGGDVEARVRSAGEDDGSARVDGDEPERGARGADELENWPAGGTDG